jgi:polyisoprenoid-binding protein YceI
MPVATAIPTGTWRADPTHSSFGFSIKHMGIVTVHGAFGAFEAVMTVPEDGGPAQVSATVQVASISTGEADRDKHLRSEDFFDVAQFPELRFAATRVEHVDEDTLRITGDLTMHGVTREITLTGEVEGTDTDPWGNLRVGVQVVGTLSRGDYGMKFNQALGSGNLMVADKVKLVLDISAVKDA